MKFDKYILVIFLFICFLSVSNVSAVDEVNGSSLNDLNTAIKTSDGNVILSNDIIAYDNESITLNGTVNIDGNNHKLYSNSNNTTLFDVNGSLTLSNLEVSNISCLFIHIHPSANVVLNNITFTNATISNNCLVYNEGNLTVNNSDLVYCTGDEDIPLFYSSNNTNTIFNKSIFKENYALLISTANNSLLNIANSEFSVNNEEYTNYCNYTPNRYMIKSSSKTNISHSKFFGNTYYSMILLDESSDISDSTFSMNNHHYSSTPIYKKSVIESSYKINISQCDFGQTGGDSVILINNGSYEIRSNIFTNNNINNAVIVDNTKNSSLLYLNLFLGCSSKNPALIYNNSGTFLNNYYGSNTPYEDGIIQSGDAGTNQSYYTLAMNVIDSESHNLSSLSPLEEISVEFNLEGGNDDEKLNIEFIEITSLNKKVRFGSLQNLNLLAPPNDNGNIYIENNNNLIKNTFYPTRWGNETIIVGSNYLSPLFTFNISINYFELKNYTMKTTFNDDIRYGENLSIAVEIKDADSLPVTGISEVIIDGDFMNIMMIINGRGNFTVNNLNTGNHTLNITYINYDIYNDIYEFRNFTVAKADLNLTISVSDTAIGKNGIISLSNIPKDLAHNISMTIDDVIEQGGEIPSVNGSAEQVFTNLTLGEKSVLIYYPGDDNYNELKIYAFFKVLTDYLKTDDIADIPDITDEFEDLNEITSNESNITDDIEGDLSIVDILEEETDSYSDFIEIDEYLELDDVPDSDFENTIDIPSFEDNKADNSSEIILYDNIADNTGIPLIDSEIISDIETVIQNTLNNQDNLNTTDDDSIGDKLSYEKVSTSKETAAPGTNSHESSNEKAYEVDKVTKQINNNNLIPFALFIILIIVLTFIGYRHHKKNNDRY